MIYHITDSRGVYTRTDTIDPYGPIPIGSLTAPPVTAGTEVAQLQGSEWRILPTYPPEEPTPEEQTPEEPTPEQLREIAKAAREVAVANIKVTTAAGNTFDGDETAQTRMARAALVLSTGAAESVPWVLADNTVIQASAAELTEALALAGAEQARLWVLPSGII